MVGWHHQLNGHGFGQTPGVGDGQGGLTCCGSRGRKESDTTKGLNWNWNLSLINNRRKEMEEAYHRVPHYNFCFKYSPTLLSLFSSIVFICQPPNLIESNYLPTPPQQSNISSKDHLKKQCSYTLNVCSQRFNATQNCLEILVFFSRKIAFSFVNMTILQFFLCPQTSHMSSFVFTFT